MSHIDGPVTLDYDGAGGIWAGTPDGALRFDTATGKFTEFKSVNPKGPNGAQGATYGIAGDKDGNGYWTQMAFDTLVKADLKTGKTVEVRLPPVKDEMALATAADNKFYETYGPRDIGTPFPWSQGPRRMSIDRDNGIIWVANSWSGSLARVDTKTMQTTLIPFPNTVHRSALRGAADKKQNVWAPMWTTDQIAKYDSTTANGRCSTCRPAAPKCASLVCSNRATKTKWCSALRDRARWRCCRCAARPRWRPSSSRPGRKARPAGTGRGAGRRRGHSFLGRNPLRRAGRAGDPAREAEISIPAKG